MDSGGIPDNWTPPEPPERGSWMWKYNTAVAWVIDHGFLSSGTPIGKVQTIIRLPTIDGIDLGYMAICRSGVGYNYIYADEILYEKEHLDGDYTRIHR